LQAKTLLGRTECPEPIFKGWLRQGVILPAVRGRGAGTHADYDEANAVALLIGVKMKQAGVTVGNYASALAELQVWLRKASSLDWKNYVVALTPKEASIFEAGKILKPTELALVIHLDPVCKALSESVHAAKQYSLFGLQAVGNSK
jgi:hypothetical protein